MKFRCKTSTDIVSRATVISAVRLWQLTIALHLSALDPTCMFKPWTRYSCPYSVLISLTDSDTNSQLFGDIELNIWILVASIPALRPLIGKLIRNSRSKDSKSAGLRSSWYRILSFSSLKSRVLSKYGRSYSYGDGHLPLNEIESTGAQSGAQSTPLENKGQNLGFWTPRNFDSTEIKTPAKGIQVQQEFNTS